MKTTISFIFFLIINTGFSQTHNWSPIEFNNEGNVEFVSVFEVPDKTASEIFTEAKVWVGSKFKSAQDVIQVDDPAAGILMGNGMSSIPIKVLGKESTSDLKYTFKIEVKDGKVRVTMNNYFLWTSTYGNQSLEQQFTDKSVKKNGEVREYPESLRLSVPNHFMEFVASLEESMKKKKDDW